MGESRRSGLDYETYGRERYIERNSEFNPRMGNRRSGPDIETRNLEREAAVLEVKSQTNNSRDSSNNTNNMVKRNNIKNNTSHIFANKETLLQTAEADCVNVQNKISVRSRIILDNASNRSYISEELREDLRLRKIGRETINVAVFGQSETRSQGCDIVEVHIKSLWDPNKTVKITATVVPYICQAINYESIEWEKEEYDAFRDVELADYGLKEKDNKNENISILIGADYYWSFVENDVIRNKNGPG